MLCPPHVFLGYSKYSICSIHGVKFKINFKKPIYDTSKIGCVNFCGGKCSQSLTPKCNLRSNAS